MQLEAGGTRRAIAFPMASAGPHRPRGQKRSSRLGHARDRNARDAIVPRQQAGRLLSLWDESTSQLCSGDRTQLARSEGACRRRASTLRSHKLRLVAIAIARSVPSRGGKRSPRCLARRDRSLSKAITSETKVGVIAFPQIRSSEPTRSGLRSRGKGIARPEQPREPKQSWRVQTAHAWLWAGAAARRRVRRRLLCLERPPSGAGAGPDAPPREAGVRSRTPRPTIAPARAACGSPSGCSRAVPTRRAGAATLDSSFAQMHCSGPSGSGELRRHRAGIEGRPFTTKQ